MSAQGGLRRSRAGRAQEKVGPGPPRHFAHLSNLAHIAHAVHLAQTHFGRPAHVATLASKTQLAIIIITMAIITTAEVSPKSLPAKSRNSPANNGGSRHMRRGCAAWPWRVAPTPRTAMPVAMQARSVRRVFQACQVCRFCHVARALRSPSAQSSPAPPCRANSVKLVKLIHNLCKTCWENT